MKFRAPNRLAAQALSAVVLLALVFASHAAEADLARAKDVVENKCFMCHGSDGESSSPVFPRLAGQNPAYLTRQLADFKSGRRKSAAMEPMVSDLEPADFDALGKFFATKPVHIHAVEDPLLAQVGSYVYARGNPFSGVAACATCHGDKAQGTDKLPRLAGQHAQYTERQLQNFNQRARTNDNAIMHAVATKLTELERKGVASYLSGLK